MMNKNRFIFGVILSIVLIISVVAYILQTSTSQLSYPQEICDPTLPSENQKIVCIVFDDGWKSQLEAVQILDNLGFKATFAIVTSYTQHPNYMTWEQIATLAQNGHDIQSHTCDHISLNNLDNETLFYQIVNSQQILRSKGYAANIFVYPFGEGTGNSTVRKVVSQYYLLARATNKGSFNISSVDKYAVNAYGITNTTSMNQFESYLNGTKGDICTILYYHRIGDGRVNTMVTKEQFQTQMQHLKDNNYAILTMQQLFLKKLSS